MVLGGGSFTPSDFLDLGSRRAVDLTLHRLIQRKILRRLARGLYEYPRRHYSDMAALARHAVVDRALARGDLRQRVADWKSRFFAASWAKYDEAKPGTFRLVPPNFRLDELKKDYQTMQDMFLAQPPPFEEILTTVRDLEKRINGIP